MAVTSGFFNARFDEDGNYDREYVAEQFASYFASFIGNGVFPNPSSGLQVTSGFGLSVNVLSGRGWINGYWVDNSDTVSFPLTQAHGVLTRIDAVVMRWSSGYRTIDFFIKEGVPSLEPQAPEPQRDADMFELVLAHVVVEKNVIQITQTNIIDKRLDKILCGIVHGLIEQIDTTTIGLQLQTFIDEYMALYNARYQEFLAFIESLKGLCNTAYQLFLEFLNGLRYQAQDDRDTFKAYITELRHDADVFYGGFVDWLTNYKNETITETTALMEQLRDLIDTEDIGSLLNQVNDLKKLIPTATIGTIHHSMNKYVNCVLYKISYAAGIGGAGIGPAGGGNLIKIQDACEIDGFDTVVVVAPNEFSDCTEIYKMSDTEYAFVSTSSDVKTQSLYLILS